MTRPRKGGPPAQESRPRAGLPAHGAGLDEAQQPVSGSGHAADAACRALNGRAPSCRGPSGEAAGRVECRRRGLPAVPPRPSGRTSRPTSTRHCGRPPESTFGPLSGTNVGRGAPEGGHCGIPPGAGPREGRSGAEGRPRAARGAGPAVVLHREPPTWPGSRVERPRELTCPTSSRFAMDLSRPRGHPLPYGCHQPLHR